MYFAYPPHPVTVALAVRELDDLGAAVVGSYLGSRGPQGRFGGGIGDVFGRSAGWGRGFWVG